MLSYKDHTQKDVLLIKCYAICDNMKAKKIQ